MQEILLNLATLEFYHLSPWNLLEFVATLERALVFNHFIISFAGDSIARALGVY